MVDKRQLGARIRAARTAKGWKQKNLASEVSVEPITVSRWERGATTPDFDVLRAVAEATDRPLSFFVGAAEPVEPTGEVLDALKRIEQKLDELLDRLGR